MDRSAKNGREYCRGCCVAYAAAVPVIGQTQYSSDPSNAETVMFWNQEVCRHWHEAGECPADGFAVDPIVIDGPACWSVSMHKRSMGVTTAVILPPSSAHTVLRDALGSGSVVAHEVIRVLVRHYGQRNAECCRGSPANLLLKADA